jgi:hypothetical protein
MPSWSIRVGEREAIEVILLSPPAKDEGYDWVSAEARIAVGGFSGCTRLTITAADMRRFHSQLQSLDRDLRGQAEFRTIEDQLYLKVGVDHLGHVNVSGYIKDDASFGNRLTFEMAFDQTLLAPIVAELGHALHQLEQWEAAKP